MTKAKTIFHQPALRAGQVLPETLTVGDATIAVGSERTSNGGSHSKRMSAHWTKGGTSGTAHIEIRPTSKTSTELSVEIERPRGAAALAWIPPIRRRLAALFAEALAYEITTRNIEEADGFRTRRTSRELVRARAS